MQKGKPTPTAGRQSRSAEIEAQERGKTRSTATVVLDDEDQEIGDSVKGRAYLEEKMLLVPDGAPLTMDALSITLFHISALAGVGRPAVNAIRAVAYLLKMIEYEAIAETVRDIASAQFNEVASDLREFTEGLREKLVEEIEGKTADLEKKAGELGEAVEKAAQQAGNTGGISYRDALTRTSSGAPMDANPRLAAKESIRQRQSLIDLPRGSSLRDCANSDLASKFSEAMGRATAQKHKIRSAIKIKNGGVLVEMATDEGAAWLASKPNAVAFLRELGESEASFKARSHNVVAYYVPLSLDTNSDKDRKEIEEVNNIPEGGLTKIRWIKPPMRRRPDQRFAHIIATFSDVDSANRAIANGLTICNKRVSVEKCRKEPIRCLKCQGWDHVAAECIIGKEVNICGTCGDRDHWTSKCGKRDVTHCTSCKTDDHSSWDRGCPTFLRKVEELNARDPANDLPFFPAKESWTWSPSYPPQARWASPAEIQVKAAPLGSQRSRYKQTQLNFAPAASGGRPYTKESRTRQASSPSAAKSPPPHFPNPESPIAPPSLDNSLTPVDSVTPQVVTHV